MASWKGMEGALAAATSLELALATGMPQSSQEVLLTNSSAHHGLVLPMNLASATGGLPAIVGWVQMPMSALQTHQQMVCIQQRHSASLASPACSPSSSSSSSVACSRPAGQDRESSPSADGLEAATSDAAANQPLNMLLLARQRLLLQKLVTACRQGQGTSQIMALHSKLQAQQALQKLQAGNYTAEVARLVEASRSLDIRDQTQLKRKPQQPAAGSSARRGASVICRAMERLGQAQALSHMAATSLSRLFAVESESDEPGAAVSATAVSAGAGVPCDSGTACALAAAPCTLEEVGSITASSLTAMYSSMTADAATPMSSQELGGHVGEEGLLCQEACDFGALCLPRTRPPRPPARKPRTASASTKVHGGIHKLQVPAAQSRSSCQLPASLQAPSCSTVVHKSRLLPPLSSKLVAGSRAICSDLMDVDVKAHVEAQGQENLASILVTLAEGQRQSSVPNLLPPCRPSQQHAGGPTSVHVHAHIQEAIRRLSR